MIPVAFDTETALIRPALLAPPMVCMTWQARGGKAYIRHWQDCENILREWLTDKEILVVGHNVAYDMAVVCAQFPELIPHVFAAYRSGRITCTKKRQQLLDIAGGVFRGRPGEGRKWIPHNYGLDDLSRRHLGKPMQKDGWRLEYANFRDIPLERWPERAKEIQARSRARLDEIGAVVPEELEAEVKNLRAIVADVPEGVVRYPLDDATTTLAVFEVQEHHAEFLRDQYRQAYVDFALHLSSAWGLRTHAAGVEALRVETERALEAVQGELVRAGLVREDGSRDTKAAKRLMVQICRERGMAVRRTDAARKCPICMAAAEGTGPDECEEHVSLDSDACAAVATLGGAKVEEVEDIEEYEEQLSESSETMGAYAEYSTLKKVLSTDCEMLLRGIEYPVHTRYDIAETGRKISSKPNIQNLRRLPGIREAFVPRPGHVFIQADYPQLELYTLAQCCYAWLQESALGDALNTGLDPHLAMAATILGVSYEEALANRKRADVDNARQTAKVANFGFPGGLGAPKLVLFARKSYGVELTLARAKELKEQWFMTWPEMRKYFARIGGFFPEGVERATIETLYTERRRGGATYCGASNNGFQALGADCASRALELIAEAQYGASPLERDSPLFGTRTVAFVHDEIIAEAREEVAHEAAHELARLMVAGANQYLKDVPLKLEKMEPTLMRVWSKKAKQVFDATGRLVPWEMSA